MILLDTSILARLPDTASPERPLVLKAVSKLMRRGEELVIVPQNVYEFWAVATRRPGTLASGGQNGLGMTVERATLWLKKVQNLCRVLPEIPDVLSAWQSLVLAHRVTGFKAHDLRLVAAMQSHGVPSVLTLNGRHFAGFGLGVFDPSSV